MEPPQYIIKGVPFAKVKDAAEHFKVDKRTIFRWLASGESERKSLPEPKRPGAFGSSLHGLKNCKFKPKQTTIFGASFHSRREAANQLGIARSSIDKLLHNLASPALKEHIYLAVLQWRNAKNAVDPNASTLPKSCK